MDQESNAISRRPRRFTDEFRAGAVCLVLDEGKTIPQVARGPLCEPGSSARGRIGRRAKPASRPAEREELAKLRKQVRELTIERDNDAAADCKTPRRSRRSSPPLPRWSRTEPPPATGKPDVSADKPNALWTADYKGWWRTGDMKRCEPLTVRDQHSRFVLAVHVSHSAHLAEAQQVFERLFELHGLPERILTDNGAPFVHPAVASA